jgi:hypothetical protein
MVLEIDPNNIQAWNRKGNIICFLKKYEESMASLAWLISKNDASSWNTIATFVKVILFNRACIVKVIFKFIQMTSMTNPMKGIRSQGSNPTQSTYITGSYTS